ncbi:putative mediator of replication checkpoint protein [Clavispora lusitaniae]|uniref:Mediator of replication checkpoint protein n=1 Tax=Clavispora lusitaniae TaxID=36911 RepID=A0ACD0WQ49_CLALS|nr:putative mediator of replication checkpoint protein [Clavispora lusitaniae]QFZ35294.1 putative mediator of replication checkpoint protein [Clavispora lusitaniae]QFZ40988.1 putative mediator of replication checkpoint protein [Clavispora lusitaniae]QFZ46669.1 putative mediator of replication checkpoint protein [Clavispora lusitaniae]QFZ52334.1 putative mediator of replication checkpoint protein [Clavispora lusitaniae]
MADLSILERVKKRLFTDDTQVIPDFEQSILFSDKTQQIGAVRLPQLPLDEMEFAERDTNTGVNTEKDQNEATEGGKENIDTTTGSKKSHHEPIDSERRRIDNLFEDSESGGVGNDSQNGGKTFGSQEAPENGSHDGRKTFGSQDALENGSQSAAEPLDFDARVAALVEQKRLERLRAVEAEEAKWRDGPAVDSSTQGGPKGATKKELEKMEQLLYTQKRSRPIAPAFARRAANPLSRLVAELDSDEESNQVNGDELGENVQNANEKHGTNDKHDSAGGETKEVSPEDNSPSSDHSGDELNVLDLITQPTQPAPRRKRNPIDDYAQRLLQRAESNVVLDDSDTEGTPDVPEMTKEQRLAVKKRYSRRPDQMRATSKFHPPRARTVEARLADQLRRANARQLREARSADPDAALLEEIEQEEEEMGTLLEREMERVRRLRKRERAEAEKKEDEEYAPGDSDASVPDSDGDSVNDSEAGEEDEGDDDGDDDRDDNVDDEDEIEGDENTASRRRARRVVESDAEEERHDDSYMFGGGAERDEDGELMQIQSDGVREPSPLDVAAIVPTERSRFRLFDNLEQRAAPAVAETSIDESFGPAPSFVDLPTQDTQRVKPTQADEPTQADASTQADNSQADKLPERPTQTDRPSQTDLLTQAELTQPDGTSTQADATTMHDTLAGDESDGDYPAAVHRGKLEVQNSVVTTDMDAEKDAEKEAERAAEALALFEARIRRKELRARRRRKELERRGVGAIVEGEAEESEDEWKGVGGADVDESDQADSEDERMIDNTFNLVLNDEEVRRKFMEQYRVKDRKELEKLMDDVKNHRLSKRARAGKFDVELSDEEDELLMAYRRQKLQEQKQRLLANKQLQRLAKNDRAQAFFESIQDEPVSIALDESDGESPAPSNIHEDEDGTDTPKEPRRIVIEESFVQQQLSFLSKTAEDDYMAIQEESSRQHGNDNDDDDDVEDLATLKSRSLSNLYNRTNSPEERGKRSYEEVLTDEDIDNEQIDRGKSEKIQKDDGDNDDDDDDDDASFPLFKRPSVVGSFRSFHEKQGVQVSTKSFSGVTVSKQYKVASGAKASISYLSKTSKSGQKNAVRSLKVKQIEETIDRSRSGGSFFGKGSNFS